MKRRVGALASVRLEAVSSAVLRDFEPPPIPVHLVYPAGRLLPLKLRAFLDFAIPRLQAALRA